MGTALTINSRRKGAAGERELFAELSAQLGTAVRRNLSQSRAGGADSIDVPGFAIEVKRCEVVALDKWIDQTIAQAQCMEATGVACIVNDDGSVEVNPAPLRVRPVLFYRQSRQPWRAVVDLCDLNGEMWPVRFRSFATLSFSDACQWMRETLTAPRT